MSDQLEQDLLPYFVLRLASCKSRSSYRQEIRNNS